MSVNLVFIRKDANTINISKGGVPWGQLYTYKDKRTEWHPWHLKTLSGVHRTFGGEAYQTTEDKKIACVDAMLFASTIA